MGWLIIAMLSQTINYTIAIGWVSSFQHYFYYKRWNLESAAIIRLYHKQCEKNGVQNEKFQHFYASFGTPEEDCISKSKTPLKRHWNNWVFPKCGSKPIWELLHMHKSAVKLAALLQLLSYFRFPSFHFSASRRRFHSRYSRWPSHSCTTGHENIALGYTIGIILSGSFLLWCILEKRYANRYDCGRREEDSPEECEEDWNGEPIETGEIAVSYAAWGESRGLVSLVWRSVPESGKRG